MVVYTTPRNVCTAHRSYVVAGSETGDVGRDWLSHKEVGSNLFCPPPPKKNEINNNLRRRHFLLYLGCSSGSSSQMSNNTDGDAQVPENDLKNSSTVVWRDIDPSLFKLQNILVARKHPHNSLSSCCSSLLVQTSVLKHPDASCNQYKPLQSTSKLSGSSPKAQAQVQFPQLQGCFATEFQKNRRVWGPVHGSSETLKPSSALCVRICGLGLMYRLLGANDVGAKRRKSGVD